MRLRIKEILKDRKVTVVELSKRIGITQANTSNIVNGKTSPSLQTLENIAIALDVSITALFDESIKSNTSIICPHCGKPIAIKVE